MIQYSKLEKFLRHRDLILSVAIFSVLWLTPNCYYVYWSMMKDYAPFWRELVSAGVALLVAAGILICTLHGDIKMATRFMYFEIAVSAFFYIITLKWSWWLFPAIGFTLMLPNTLKYYATRLNKDGLISDDILERDRLYSIDFANQINSLRSELKIHKEHGELMEKHACENKEHGLMIQAIFEKTEKEYIDKINQLEISNEELNGRIEELKAQPAQHGMPELLYTQMEGRINELMAENKALLEEREHKLPDVMANLSEADLLKMAENQQPPLPSELF